MNFSSYKCSTERSMRNDSIHNMTHSRMRPELPPLPRSANEEPSDLYKTVMSHSFYPPLMQRTSWTKAAPFKDQIYYCGPSDSIANNYSMAARELKLRDLLKIYQPVTIITPSEHQRSKIASRDGPKAKRLKFASKKKSDNLRGILPTKHLTSIGSNSMVSGMDISDLPGSRPMSPEEQIDMMMQEEKERAKSESEPSELDLERYYYYVTNGIRKDMIAQQDEDILDRILKLIPSYLLKNPNLETLLKNLVEENEQDYYSSLMKDIVDYILMDPREKERLFITNIPHMFPQRIIRAPVPWYKEYKTAKLWNEEHLFIVNPMMLVLRELWFSEFCNIRFVRTAELLAGPLPLLPGVFFSVIQQHCIEARQILLDKWIPTCAQHFISQKDHWLRFAPKSDFESSQMIEEYFASVASFMSLQLREIVINSLKDLVNFFMIHKDGNDFDHPYKEMEFFIPQVILIKLQVEEPSIIFNPPFKECWNLIYSCFMEVIKSSENIPKVEANLFPELQGDNLTLGTVCPDEMLVLDFVRQTEEVFEKNQIGPKKYLDVYHKYNNLLDGTAEKDVVSFLSQAHDLDDFVVYIDSMKKLKGEIASMHITVPLALFCLDALALNENLCERTQLLKDKLIQFQVDENREQNTSLCNQYSMIADKVSEIPLNTEELVNLVAFLKKASEVTVFKLRRQISDAAWRLEFLMNYAYLPSDDIKLNSTLFLWPDQIEDIFEISRNLLYSKREQAEMNLIKRCAEFEGKLENYFKDVESFRKKDVINMEEMKNNVEKLNELTRNLDSALEEFELINKEEELLDKEKSKFPLLQVVMTNKVPFEQLWLTAYNFFIKSEEWMNGPLYTLNAEEITEEVGNMWRTMYKLTKTLSDLPGPKRVAENVKFKMDKFKMHLPVLAVACNKGMKERHWKQQPYGMDSISIPILLTGKLKWND
ncbi:dynein axonemal heavy chain 3 isoform X6 [Macrotis lagotis]|uniref:dynein axonemal heavy chain 3 isoform X6 n=1 Tax=Macrotis lagotis TaxID=92651 RepID=UPI003D694E25